MQRRIFTKVSFYRDDLKYHIVFWIVLYLLHWFNFAYTFISPSKEYLYMAMMTANLTLLSTIFFAYVNTYYLLPATIGNEKIVWWQALLLYFSIATILVIAGSALFQHLHGYSYLFDKSIKAPETFKYDGLGHKVGDNAINFDWKRNIPESVFNMFLLLGLVLTRRWFHNSEEFRLKNELLEKDIELLEKNAEVQTYRVKSLNQQIKPHFLFNALNHIYLKSLQNPTAVPEIVELFSDALEYITYDCAKDKVPLIKELKFIEKFIAIELQGLDKRNYQLDLEIDENSFDKKLEITPLLLVVLVENGIKYGIKKTDDKKWLKLKIRVRNGNELIFSMKNSQPISAGGSEVGSTGVGIKNLRERLKTFYQGQHELELNSKNNLFETKLKINL
jgi:two-component system, LytTR family, sensor kinase